MNVKLVILIGLILPASVIAQNRERDFLYWLDLKQINPAFAGINGSQFLFESRLHEFDGKLRHRGGAVSADVFHERINSGFGLMFDNEIFGAVSQSQINLQYNYRFKWNDGKSFLATGLGLHTDSYDINLEDFRPVDPDDPWLTDTTDERVRYFNCDIGFVLKLDKTTLGLSVSDIIQREFDFQGTVHPLFSVYADHEFKAGEFFKVKPGLSFFNMAFSDGSRTNRLDVNCTGFYKSLLFGTGMLTMEEVTLGQLFLGYEIKNRFTLGVNFADRLNKEPNNFSSSTWNSNIMARMRF
jgi:type IX secretion system PorP/SprF family membrane protein